LECACYPLNQAVFGGASLPSSISGKGESVSEAYDADTHDRCEYAIEKCDDVVLDGIGRIPTGTQEQHGGSNFAGAA
jgi:hypothetical protein